MRRFGILLLALATPLLLGGIYLTIAGPVVNGLLALWTGLMAAIQGGLFYSGRAA